MSSSTHLEITAAGPAVAVWFGIGLNATTMGAKPWTLIVDGQGQVRASQLFFGGCVSAVSGRVGRFLAPRVSVVACTGAVR
jgi:hypothetical protein